MLYGGSCCWCCVVHCAHLVKKLSTEESHKSSLNIVIYSEGICNVNAIWSIDGFVWDMRAGGALSIMAMLLERAGKLNQAFSMVRSVCKTNGFQANVQAYTCLIHRSAYFFQTRCCSPNTLRIFWEWIRYLRNQHLQWNNRFTVWVQHASCSLRAEQKSNWIVQDVRDAWKYGWQSHKKWQNTHKKTFVVRPFMSNFHFLYLHFKINTNSVSEKNKWKTYFRW